jgi:sulfate adenylyltransferase
VIIGCDHAGVGKYYGSFDAQKIFHEIPNDALAIKMLPIDWTFYCYTCKAMGSYKTCPHGDDEHLLLNGTLLREMLTKGEPVPEEFSRPEVLAILREYYSSVKNIRESEI